MLPRSRRPVEFGGNGDTHGVWVEPAAGWAISVRDAFLVVRAGNKDRRGEGNKDSCSRNVRARHGKKRINLTAVPE